MFLWFRLIIPSFPPQIYDMGSRFSALSARTSLKKCWRHLLLRILTVLIVATSRHVIPQTRAKEKRAPSLGLYDHCVFFSCSLVSKMFSDSVFSFHRSLPFRNFSILTKKRSVREKLKVFRLFWQLVCKELHQLQTFSQYIYKLNVITKYTSYNLL